MVKKDRFAPWFGVVFLVLAVAFFCVGGAFAADASEFTRYNIHVQEKVSRSGEYVYNASYANYTDPGAGHLVIPAGTKITVLKKNRKGFRFRVEGDGKLVDFDFHEPRMKMSVDQYLELITSTAPVSMARFSAVDKKGIAAGKALVGMSRDGVMTALGYPAIHRTPSLEARTWVYWTNRFGTIAVNFNPQGKVASIKN